MVNRQNPSCELAPAMMELDRPWLPPAVDLPIRGFSPMPWL